MAETINTYWAKFGIDTSEFTGGIGKAQTSFLAFYSQVTIAAEMTIELFGRLGEQIKKFGEMANQIKDLEYQTGLSGQRIQELRYATQLAGSDLGTLTNSLNVFTRSIEMAGVATTEQAKAFAKLGVKTDGRTVDEILQDTITALNGMQSETARNTLAQNLFGRSAKEVVLIFKEYQDSIAAIKSKPFMSEADLNTLDEARKKWTDLTTSVELYTARIFTIALKDPAFFLGGINDLPAMYQRIFGDRGLGGADWTNPNANKKSSEGVDQLIDSYAGLTDEAIDLKDAQQALNKAKEDMALAKTQEEYDVAARSVQLYTNRIAALTAAQGELNKVSASSGSKWSNTAIVGTAGSDMYDYLMQEMENGVTYEQAMQKWAQGAKHNEAGSLGAAKEAGASTAPKVKKIETENKAIADATRSGYVELETMTLDHETAMAEMARVKYQRILDMGAEAVNWMGSNPIIQKQAVLSKSGYDIDISPLPTVTAPKLAAADFGSIKMTGGSAAGGSGSGSNITINQTNNIVTKDNPDAIATASRKQAEKIVLGGGG